MFRRAGTKSTRGILITLEGGEGSGKTTQCFRLAKRLRQEGYHVLLTREPGGTRLGERLRQIILDTRSLSEPIDPRSEALLILASRSHHIVHLIKPALQAGMVVICDRFSDSTLAYQGQARGLGHQPLVSMNRFATRGISPDMTVLLDVAVQEGLARRKREGKSQDRLDQETRRFHQQVRRGFLRSAAREPRRIKVVDAGQEPETVANSIASIVLPFLKRRRVQPRVRKSLRS